MNLRDNSIDLVSFNKLFTEYHERFVRFAYTYVDNYMEAEDIVMEAMTYYWENRTRLFGVNPPAYIFTTIKNKRKNNILGIWMLFFYPGFLKILFLKKF